MNSINNSTEQFLSLLMANQKKIYASIIIKVPNANDADDIMQETVTVMWQKFDQFELNTNFGAWGVQIAHYSVMSFRKKRARDRLHFSDDLLEVLDAKQVKALSDIELRVNILEGCLQKLPNKDRELIQLRYEQGKKTTEISKMISRPIHGLYKAMARIQDALVLCVRKNYMLEDRN